MEAQHGHRQDAQSPTRLHLPDPPKSQDEKMTASKHLSLTSGAHFLAQHLGNPDTTIVRAEAEREPRLHAESRAEQA